MLLIGLVLLFATQLRSESEQVCTSSSCSKDVDDLRYLYDKLTGAVQPDLLPFDEWNFTLPGRLPVYFPIEAETKNYVRRVQNVVFSPVRPTPFETTCRLAAVSDDALETVLDIDSSSVWNDDFLNFASGNRIRMGSNPLSHRYGGHQVELGGVN